jgi:uncharacterized protein (UPF0332 family)
MGLQEQEKIDLVKYRLDKANATLAEVFVQLENQFYRTAVNRLYYACYYAATAILINENYESKTHSGVKTLLGLHFFKENRIDKAFSLLYDKLFNLRQTGDYEDWVYLSEEDVFPLVEPAKQFIKTIENLINNEN